LSTTPNLIRELHCPRPESVRTLQVTCQNFRRRHEEGREVRMGVWKRARVFNWELVFWISALISAFITLGALLAYHSFVLAGR